MTFINPAYTAIYLLLYLHVVCNCWLQGEICCCVEHSSLYLVLSNENLHECSHT